MVNGKTKTKYIIEISLVAVELQRDFPLIELLIGAGAKAVDENVYTALIRTSMKPSKEDYNQLQDLLSTLLKVTNL